MVDMPATTPDTTVQQAQADAATIATLPAGFIRSKDGYTFINPAPSEPDENCTKGAASYVATLRTEDQRVIDRQTGTLTVIPFYKLPTTDDEGGTFFNKGGAYVPRQTAEALAAAACEVVGRSERQAIISTASPAIERMNNGTRKKNERDAQNDFIASAASTAAQHAANRAVHYITDVPYKAENPTFEELSKKFDDTVGEIRQKFVTVTSGNESARATYEKATQGARNNLTTLAPNGTTARLNLGTIAAGVQAAAWKLTR